MNFKAVFPPYFIQADNIFNYLYNKHCLINYSKKLAYIYISKNQLNYTSI